jgi:DNA polymerase zeta
MPPPVPPTQITGAQARNSAPAVAAHGSRTAVPGKGNHLTILSVEILADCRGKLLPDPKYDPVLAVALTVWYDHEDVSGNKFETRLIVPDACGHAPLATGPDTPPIPQPSAATLDAQLDRVPDEAALLDAVLQAIRALDPDVIVAFDIMRGSIGYLEARARELDVRPPFLRQLGRCPRHPGAAPPDQAMCTAILELPRTKVCIAHASWCIFMAPLL